MADFLRFLSKKYLRQIPILGTDELKSEKKTFFISTFKIGITIAPLVYQILTHWYLKLRFVSNTFWTKNPKNTHCVQAALDIPITATA